MSNLTRRFGNLILTKSWNLFVPYFGASTFQKKAIFHENRGHLGFRTIFHSAKSKFAIWSGFTNKRRDNRCDLGHQQFFPTAESFGLETKTSYWICWMKKPYLNNGEKHAFLLQRHTCLGVMFFFLRSFQTSKIGKVHGNLVNKNIVPPKRSGVWKDLRIQ